MIYSVTGKLTHIETGLAVVECGGVGYACRTTATSLDGLKTGDNVMFLTHMSVREDAVELFGFTTAYELSCFVMLLSVSGVGPKAALSILSDMSPQDFALAVVADDAKALSRVKGIGAKTAQLIILKLKDKLENKLEHKIGKAEFSSGASPVTQNADSAALGALTVLGFSASEAARALSGLPNDMDTAEKIKSALKKLSRK